MSKKKEEKHNLGRVTNQLLHEQMVRQNYSTTKGFDRINSASNDNRSPGRAVNNNFMLGGESGSMRGLNNSSEWALDDPAR